ncbi:hypothetical protein Pcinc_035252 [Petrolisthes cinctipes]|uniref:Uncharacterized protein n=1 Tax=Petrolisthes cinctipes TaxID=88211 RepID=A0AAE1EPW7_PETCI|nr:hypothetical protein Pcinc_035252 [Petrolisthes cinctipes]
MMKTNLTDIVLEMALAVQLVGKCNHVHNCICMDNFCIDDSEKAREEEEKRSGQEEEKKRETASEEKLQEQQNQKKEKEESSSSQETKVQDVEKVDRFDVEKEKEEGECESDDIELEKWKREFKMSLTEESREEEKPLQSIDERVSKRISEDELLSPPKKTRVKEGENSNQETGSESDK